MILKCPGCGAREDEIVNGMFSGPEPAIRRSSNGTAECMKCGFWGTFQDSNNSRKDEL